MAIKDFENVKSYRWTDNSEKQLSEQKPYKAHCNMECIHIYWQKCEPTFLESIYFRLMKIKNIIFFMAKRKCGDKI